MSKFSIPKEMLPRFKTVFNDLAFHKRASNRINTELQVLLAMEARRTGVTNKKVKDIDIGKGEIEYEDIIVSKDVKDSPSKDK